MGGALVIPSVSSETEAEVAPVSASKDEIPRVGLVLSGGGARGAYEVGVLRYIRERIRRPTRSTN